MQNSVSDMKMERGRKLSERRNMVWVNFNRNCPKCNTYIPKYKRVCPSCGRLVKNISGKVFLAK
jgi:rRNA maturation endonuclease Nob1